MKSPKASSIRGRFGAAPAVAKNAHDAMRLGGFISKAWRASKRNERLRPHDIELCVVSLGAALGGVRFVDGDIRENRPRRRRFGFCYLDPHRGYSGGHRLVRVLRREME